MRKEDYKEIKNYKDEPEGSVNKRIYDRYFLPFQEYLKKYYSDDKRLDRWKYFTDKFVKPLFDGTPYRNYRDFLYQATPPFCPDPEKLEIAWELLKDDARFDEELKQFFAFMCACGFLEDWHITFEQFLRISNWMHPWYEEECERKESILEVLNHNYGVTYLKSLLAGAPWLKR
ncbi:MAG: hypothetical protein LBG19_11420 [Prevotellaceae bacterium]|jgi:hypothetical protein|nr:hypothetical protein [Prevotellaceae bacterium]